MSDDIHENNDMIEEEEFDSPIFIFPDDNSDDDDYDSDTPVADSSDEEEMVSTRLFASPLASADKIDTTPRLSFGRVQATKKEKEFVFMPFLDDPVEEEEDEGEESTLTFGRVQATKKEKEFVFMPFLNISDDDDSSEDAGQTKSYVVRPDGTVFDEGMLLMPLSPLDDDDDDDDDFEIVESPAGIDAEDDDIGIYVTDAGPDDYVRRPVRSPSAAGSRSSNSKKNSTNTKSSKSSKKAPPPSQQRKPSGKKSKSKNPAASTAEDQFRAAMMNINPEIRRAAMRDPIQRSALEQAVRIALVQQAAQEAVARLTGNPGGFGNGGYAKKSAPPKKSKKKRPAASAPMQAAPPVLQHQSQAANINVRGFSFGGFGSTPAEFSTPLQNQTPPPAAAKTDINDFGANESFEYNPAAPDVMQDPVLASLTPTTQRAPSEQQDPVLSALSTGSSSSSGSSGSKTITSYSPAAIRAAMRAGIDLSLPQTAAAAASASQSSASAQKAKMLETTNTRRSGCLIWLIVLFIVFFIGILAIAVWPSLSTELKYQEASTMMAAGDYVEAGELFGKLGDYKDSETKSYEAIYTYALSLQNSGQYEEAIKHFTTIRAYSASSERIAECRYILGKQYIAAGDYSAAYDQLYLIPLYNDAGDLAMESNYKCAMQLYQEGNFAGALVRFGMFPDYLDSQSYWQLCQYNSAAEQLAAGQYRGAYTQFAELSNYNDSAYQAAVAQYYLLANGDQSFSLGSIHKCLSVIDENTSQQQFARDIIESTVYTGAKLIGTWYDEAGTSYISLSATNTSATLTLCLAEDDIPGREIVIENILFDNNIAYYMSGDSESMAIRVESFTPNDSASPDAVNIYCYSNGTSYTLYKN